MTKTELGKMTHVKFGTDLDLGFGLHFVLEGKGWGTSYSETIHSYESKSDMCDKVMDILKQAKVNFINELENVPVEVMFEDRLLQSWRILEEVL